MCSFPASLNIEDLNFSLYVLSCMFVFNEMVICFRRLGDIGRLVVLLIRNTLKRPLLKIILKWTFKKTVHDFTNYFL